MYKSYPKSKDTPSRGTRKSLRKDVFWHNKKVAKLRRKAARLARLELARNANEA